MPTVKIPIPELNNHAGPIGPRGWSSASDFHLLASRTDDLLHDDSDSSVRNVDVHDTSRSSREDYKDYEARLNLFDIPMIFENAWYQSTNSDITNLRRAYVDRTDHPRSLSCAICPLDEA